MDHKAPDPGLPVGPQPALPMPQQIVGPTTPAVEPHRREPARTREVRTVFWQNVVQQTLTAFNQRVAMNPEIADGRLAVLTHGGERVAIAAVHPLFACTVNVSPQDRALSELVQCTVFEIHTPDGEVVTLPLEEIRGLHALSDDLVDKLRAMQSSDRTGAGSEPFGFAAFTSLARERRAEAEASAERD